MAYLLNLVYGAVLILAAPKLIYDAWTKGKYRDGLSAKLLGNVPIRAGDRPCVWLHGVSVGEVNLLSSIVQRLGQQFPGVECVISTTTVTGYQLALNKFAEHTVFYCPLDFSWAVRRAIKRMRPNLLVLGELELWPNLVSVCHQNSIPITIVNARLSENSFQGYVRVRPFIKRILEKVSLVLAQTDEYAERFVKLGMPRERVMVTGSIKFDGASSDRRNRKTQDLIRIGCISEADVVFMAGSTQDPEERIALESYLQLRDAFPQLRLVLVPRHAERFEAVAKLLDASGVDWTRRSRIDESNPHSHRVLLSDTIGELGAWWGAADIAYVGGSMGDRGGQNMIEPAAYGCAVSFGPNTKNFRDVVRLLLDAEAAVVVNDQQALTDFARKCLNNPDFAREMGTRSARLVQANAGALDRSMSQLSRYIEQREGLASEKCISERRGSFRKSA